MNKLISILIVGIGGYGQLYSEALLNNAPEDCVIAGVVDPKPENSNFYSLMLERKIPVYSSVEDFFKDSSADLTIISSPIQFHSLQTCLALQNGSNVLCEKPLSATVEGALAMIAARDSADKFLAVGYNWSFAKSILELKHDIIQGIFGRPKRLKTMALWPRTSVYYSRGWAGKKRDAAGNWVLDSVANNATAHYLHNMFYVLGKEIDTSTRPEYVTAELYRANHIENFDTSAVRIITDEGVELLFLASHAVDEYYGPVFRYEFENAVVSYDTDTVSGELNIIAAFKDGTMKFYGDPAGEAWSKKLQDVIEAVRNGGSISCGPEAALSHTICINAMQDSVPEINGFPEEILKVKTDADKKGEITYVEGLVDILKDCYHSGMLPSEKGVPWARAGKTIRVDR